MRWTLGARDWRLLADAGAGTAATAAARVNATMTSLEKNIFGERGWSASNWLK